MKTKFTPNNVLCIIDMQGHWHGWGKNIELMRTEIRKAKRKKWAIVIVEYGTAPTNDKLMRTIAKYPHLLVNKKDIDGTTEILTSLKNARIKPTAIFAFGSETTCCVRATVTGLRKQLGTNKVNVIGHCCLINPWREDLMTDPTFCQEAPENPER